MYLNLGWDKETLHGFGQVGEVSQTSPLSSVRSVVRSVLWPLSVSDLILTNLSMVTLICVGKN